MVRGHCNVRRDAEAMEGDCCPSTAHGEATFYLCARNKGRELKNAEKMCQTHGQRDKSLGVVSGLVDLGRQNLCFAAEYLPWGLMTLSSLS